MIRIIDSTLCALDDDYLTPHNIKDFIELMKKIGIHDLQISIPVYEKMAGNLPEQINYYLALDTASYVSGNFPRNEKISYYFVPKYKREEKQIEAFQINDIEDPITIPDIQPKKLIKITGVDNLLMRGCEEGITALAKKYRLQQMILCPLNTYHCATAIAILFLKKKGYAVVTSFLGEGNKAATEQVLMAMHVMERFKVNQTFEGFTQLSEWMQEVTGKEISMMAPVVGKHIFYVESGVHVDGILKKSDNYEPYHPDEVGLQRQVVIGKHSGKNSILYKMKQLDLELANQEDLEHILKLVKEKSKSTGAQVTDDEFVTLVKGYAVNGK